MHITDGGEKVWKWFRRRKPRVYVSVTKESLGVSCVEDCYGDPRLFGVEVGKRVYFIVKVENGWFYTESYGDRVKIRFDQIDKFVVEKK